MNHILRKVGKIDVCVVNTPLEGNLTCYDEQYGNVFLLPLSVRMKRECRYATMEDIEYLKRIITNMGYTMTEAKIRFNNAMYNISKGMVPASPMKVVTKPAPAPVKKAQPAKKAPVKKAPVKPVPAKKSAPKKKVMGMRLVNN